MENFVWYLLSGYGWDFNPRALFFLPGVFLGLAMPFVLLALRGVFAWGTFREKISDKNILRCLYAGALLGGVAFAVFYYKGATWLFVPADPYCFAWDLIFSFPSLYAMLAATPFFIFGCCVAYAVTTLRSSRRSWSGYFAAVLALAHIVLGIIIFGVTVNASKVNKIVESTAKMNPIQYETLLRHYPDKTKKYIVNVTLYGFLNQYAGYPPWLKDKQPEFPTATIQWLLHIPEVQNAHGFLWAGCNPEVDEQTLALLVEKSSNATALYQVAIREEMPVEIFQALSLKKDKQIDWGLVHNKSLPAKILRILADSPEGWMRSKVLYHANCPQDIKELLRDDPYENVQYYFNHREKK